MTIACGVLLILLGAAIVAVGFMRRRLTASGVHALSKDDQQPGRWVGKLLFTIVGAGFAAIGIWVLVAPR